MITKRDLKFFKLAAKAAESSTYRNKKCMLGCVVVQGKSVISDGFNSDITDPVQCEYNRFRKFRDNKSTPHKVHAEISALKKIRYRDLNWSSISIYVSRLRKDGTYGMARPCPACMQYIKDLGIRNIYYTTNNGYAFERIEQKEV